MAATPFWRKKSVQRNFTQSAFVAVLGTVVVVAVLTARANMAAQGLTSGFGFLWSSTGWELNFQIVPTSPSSPYWLFLLSGLVNTLFMGITGLIGATILGLTVGLLRSGVNPAGRLLGLIYIETFRNLPLIVQLFFWYAVANSLPAPRQAEPVAGMLFTSRGIYLPGLNVTVLYVVPALAILSATIVLACWLNGAKRFKRLSMTRRRLHAGGTLLAGAVVALGLLALGHEAGTDWVSFPEVKGFQLAGGFRIQPEFYALALAMTMFGGAYIGEIVRGGFKAVGRGQIEAAKSLGLTPWQIFSQVRMPLALRAMLPILTNQYVWLIKATTLGIAVGYSDFFMVIAASVEHSGQTMEFIALLMGGFLAINFSLAAVLNTLNRAIALKGNNIGAAE